MIQFYSYDINFRDYLAIFFVKPTWTFLFSSLKIFFEEKLF